MTEQGQTRAEAVFPVDKLAQSALVRITALEVEILEQRAHDGYQAPVDPLSKALEAYELILRFGATVDSDGQSAGLTVITGTPIRVGENVHSVRGAIKHDLRIGGHNFDYQAGKVYSGIDEINEGLGIKTHMPHVLTEQDIRGVAGTKSGRSFLRELSTLSLPIISSRFRAEVGRHVPISR